MPSIHDTMATMSLNQIGTLLKAPKEIHTERWNHSFSWSQYEGKINLAEIAAIVKQKHDIIFHPLVTLKQQGFFASLTNSFSQSEIAYYQGEINTLKSLKETLLDLNQVAIEARKKLSCYTRLMHQLANLGPNSRYVDNNHTFISLCRTLNDHESFLESSKVITQIKGALKHSFDDFLKNIAGEFGFKFEPQDEFFQHEIGDADPYETLGVQKGATQEEIKQAFRLKAKELHPDKNLDKQEEATEQFKVLLKAYQKLRV